MPLHTRAARLESGGRLLVGPLGHALSLLLRYRRRAISRCPDAAIREQSEVRLDSAASGHRRSIARRLRYRAAWALQGHPVSLSLLLLRKSLLTLDGITRQLDPDFIAWLEAAART